MPGKRAWKLIVAAAAAVALSLVFCFTWVNKPYGRGGVSADSQEIEAALAILFAIARDPANAESFMSDQATRRARQAVGAAAKQLNRADSVELKDAAWFGEYLRLRVTCPTRERPGAERGFFLKEERGELRITGLQQ